MKDKQYSRRNNVEILGITNRIPDEDLENTGVSIFKDSEEKIDPKDIEACHRLPLPRNSRGQDKRVIVKFASWKHSKALLRERQKTDK